MYDIYSRPGTSYGRGLIILLAMLAMGLFLGGAVSVLVWYAMTGKGLESMEADMSNPAFINALRVIQLVSTFFIFFVPSVIMAYILNKKPFRLLGFNFYFSSRQMGMVALIMLASLPLVGALGELNKLIPVGKELELYFKQMEDRYSDTVKLLANINSPGAYLLSLLVMAIAPAIFEETLFRGALQNLLQKISNNPWISIGVTSIIFSAIHMSLLRFPAQGSAWRCAWPAVPFHGKPLAGDHRAFFQQCPCGNPDLYLHEAGQICGRGHERNFPHMVGTDRDRCVGGAFQILSRVCCPGPQNKSSCGNGGFGRSVDDVTDPKITVTS
jgi:membrane protease YdiL (CAAX protease family)